MSPLNPAALLERLRHPRTTVRLRLTLLYGGLFLACGAGLLAITYTLVDHAGVENAHTLIGPVPSAGNPPGKVFPGPAFTPLQARLPPPLQHLLRSSAGRDVVRFVGIDQRIADQHQLIIESGIALAIMAIVSTGLGWVVAGRVLRPLRVMTATTREISAANLHERLAIAGPRDELRQLADTIDGLLGRLEGTFVAQRRFVMNASHELRTPLTAARAMLELVLADPQATVETYRETCQEVLDENRQQEELIDALLSLAQGQRGITLRERVNLAAIVAGAVSAHEPSARSRELRVESSIAPATLSGDQRLIERLASNLVENAILHNLPGGSVNVGVASVDGAAELRISNTGAQVPPDQVQRLLQPFQRLAPDRVGPRAGLGLGLSIVAAIAEAHAATLDIRPAPGGGLSVAVRFPVAADAATGVAAPAGLTETGARSSPEAHRAIQH